YETVENRVFNTAAISPASVLLDGMATSSTQTFNLTMANPYDNEVNVVFGVDESLVKQYNTIYSDNAIMLPAENYNVVEAVATFKPKYVTSTDVVVEITDLNSLDRNTVYVLPLTVQSSDIPVLESQKTRYIVVRGAALVNVVCEMTENYAGFDISGSLSFPELGNLSQITVQMLVYVNEFGGSEAGIQSLIGAEGYFLLRLGDSEPIDHIQLATDLGNVSDASWTFKAKQWTRLTFTYDCSTKEATIFVDGAKKATKSSLFRGPVDWNRPDLYIGKSYSDKRYLNGNVSEVRVWNRILSDAEIAAPEQAYSVPFDSEGLAAYWKFNEGAGTLIHDYANGYDMVMAKAPKWVPVTLPE
ncbi:MAG: DUF1735 and LamG domain-containing protein, partial [Paramuribaculum sp.]|nr:DUF1735 and LamG domain-containing protein [Paramuribaculum sp.]